MFVGEWNGIFKSEKYDGAGDGGVGGDSNKQFRFFLYHYRIVNDRKIFL